MQIIVVGGAGDVGSRAAEELTRLPGVERLTIADRDARRAARLAERLAGRGPVVRSVAVDATDEDALGAAIRGHDVAASALGPYFRFETPTARAAVAAGADYASVCDEWDATEAVLAAVDGPARAAGRIVISGLGASPGVSSLAVRRLADELDVPRRASVQVVVPLNGGGGEAMVHHALHILAGEARVWRGGRHISLAACAEHHDVQLPGLGRQRVWSLGHAEPITLPRALPTLEDVDFAMGFGRGSRWLVELSRRGVLRRPAIAAGLVRLFTAFERTIGQRAPALGALRVDVWGDLGGRPVHRMACGTGTMRDVTGVSLAVGAWMLGGRTHLSDATPGVHGPEECLDPRVFFAEMRARGLGAYRDLALTTPL